MVAHSFGCALLFNLNASYTTLACGPWWCKSRTDLLLITYILIVYNRVTDINPNGFSISWSQSPSSSCDRHTLSYNIAATSDCGECPNTTFDTSIRCTNLTVTVDGQACSVVIQTQADAMNKSEYSVATSFNNCTTSR